MNSLSLVSRARVLAAGALVAGLCAGSSARCEDGPPSLQLPRLALPITLDGVPDEEAWRDAAVLDRFYEIAPGDNAVPPVATVGLLGYDDEFLYVAARCEDPEPARLRAPWVDRDQVTNQDLVQIDLDARDEGRWSMIFRVNPRGVQGDGVFDEAVGADDFSPDFHWESATKIGERGWSLEMKIPLSTLRYRQRDPQTWRVTFFRLYPRKYRHQLVSAPMPRGTNCWLCDAIRLTGITGLPKGGGLAVTPFVTGNASQEEESGWSSQATGGADAKWLPRPNLAVDLALNPDFSQVEADAPQIGVNTRFALFYPEKRPFFLEGSDLFASPIGVANTRTVTDPGWGVRLTGRPGNSSYTLLASRDAGGGSLILPGPSSSSAVPQPEDALVALGRFRHNIGRSSVGAIATYRRADDYDNGVVGADFQWYPSVADRVAGQVLASSTRDPGEERLTSHALNLSWDRSTETLGWSLLYEDLGRDFRADSGFVPQTGVRRARASTGYTFYPSGFLRSARPQFVYEDVREPGGELVSRTSSIGVTLDGALQATLTYVPLEEARADDGRLHELSYATVSVRLLPGPRVPFLLLSGRYGDELDIAGSRVGTGAAISLTAKASAAERLTANLVAEGRRLDVDEGGSSVHLYTALVGQLKLTYTFTQRAFVRGVAQWDLLDERDAGGAKTSVGGGSLLFGYRLNWQSIVYLGYDNTLAEPGAPGRGRRQELFLKVAYTLRPR